MILFRYLSREVFQAMAVIAFVVFMIAAGSRLARYLSDAAAGALSGELVGWLLLYRLPGFLELILPISFFLAIMLAHSPRQVCGNAGIQRPVATTYQINPPICV